MLTHTHAITRAYVLASARAFVRACMTTKMVMMMREFILGKCVGGCSGRMMIDIYSTMVTMMTCSTPRGFPVGRRGIRCLRPILGGRWLAGLVRLGEGRVHQAAVMLVGRSSSLTQRQHRMAH